jgi:glucose 1-dehydrogenase
MSEEQMNTLYRLNFLAPMLVTGAASKHMAEQGIAGSIINIASSRGERAYPGDAVYGGLKAALRRATESLALELAPYGIRVNAIAPGAIQTVPGREASYAELGKKIPLERVGTPEDIGEAAVWLSSPQASYITGITLRIDGGLILPGMPEGGPGAGEYGWGRPDWTKK